MTSVRRGNLLIALVLAAGAAVSVGPIQRAAAQTPVGTVFTYQGEVRSVPSNTLVTGRVALRFRLYRSVAGGAPDQVGPQLSYPGDIPAITLVDGKFTVDNLNFGATAFDGNAKWLEIDVATLDPVQGPFVTLSPRQRITPSPNAVYASKAAMADMATSATTAASATNAANATNATNASQLGGVAAANFPTLGGSNAFTGANTFGSISGNGSGLTMLNASTAFNTAFDLPDSFLTPNVALLDRAQNFTNTNSFSANVGIGTPAPATPLHMVMGDKSFQIRRDGNLVPGINLSGTGANLGTMRIRNRAEMWPNDAATAAGSFGLYSLTGANTINLDGADGSMVANGGLRIDGANLSDGVINLLKFGPGNTGEGIFSKRTAGGNLNGLDFVTGNNSRMSITSAGSVGIGTNAPQARLEVVSTNPNLSSVLNVRGSGSFGIGVGINNQDVGGRNWIINSTGPGSAEGGGKLAITDLSVGGAGAARLTIDSTGKVGVGTTAPQEGLSVQTGIVVDQGNFGNGSLPGGLRFGAFSGEGIASRRIAGANSGGLDFYAGGGGTPRVSLTNTGLFGIGTTAPESVLHAFKGSAGAVTADASSVLTLENSSNAYLSFLTPNTQESGMLFGGPIGAADGGVLYNVPATPRGFQFRTAGNSIKAVLTNNGNFGLATTTPGSMLTLGSGGDVRLQAGVGSSDSGDIAFATGTGALKGRISCGNSTTNQLEFDVNSDGADMLIASDGRVGIGTTGPEEGLSISSGLNVDQNNQNNGTLIIDNRTIGISFGSLSGEGIASARAAGSPNQFGLDFYTGGTGFKRMSITNGGDVGIGTATPGAKLHVRGRGYIDSENFGGSAAVDLAIGDTDTGFENAADGTLDIYANNIRCARFRSTRVDFDRDVNIGPLFMNINGTIAGGFKLFQIDHPSDPENKVLRHACIESPEYKNLYDGTIELDGSGQAVITLPDYFDDLNENFRYQVTCIGGWAPVYIADEISNNEFRIAGGQGGMKVSWQVTGIRKDALARATPLIVEEEKPNADKGKYLYPEAHGKPIDMATWRSEPAAMLPAVPDND